MSKKKKETRWVIQYPSGDLAYVTAPTKKYLIEYFLDQRIELGVGCLPWRYWKNKGYKCVKVELRRIK